MQASLLPLLFRAAGNPLADGSLPFHGKPPFEAAQLIQAYSKLFAGFAERMARTRRIIHRLRLARLTAERLHYSPERFISPHFR